MKDTTGGPAFPIDEKNGDGTHYRTHYGMTLRDWFAGMVLQGYVAQPNQDEYPLELDLENPDEDLGFTELVARCCYYIADSMLKEREK